MRSFLPKAVGSPPSLGWSVLTLGGLLVGVIALMSGQPDGASSAAASRLALELPGVVLTIASAAAWLAALLWFAVLVVLPRRRRKDGERGSAIWSMFMLALLLTAIAVWQRHSPEGQFVHLRNEPVAPGQPEAHSTNELPIIVSPLFTAAVAVLIVAGALGSLALAALVLFGDRLQEWWTRPPPRPPDALATAVVESLGDLRGETDPRRAIMRCYRRFEQALAMSHVPRAPWQTPVEFMREALGRLPLPRDAAERLTRLFERARFSDEPLLPADRDAAWDALVEIRTSLETMESDAHASS